MFYTFRESFISMVLYMDKSKFQVKSIP